MNRVAPPRSPLGRARDGPCLTIRARCRRAGVRCRLCTRCGGCGKTAAGSSRTSGCGGTRWRGSTTARTASCSSSTAGSTRVKAISPLRLGAFPIAPLEIGISAVSAAPTSATMTSLYIACSLRSKNISRATIGGVAGEGGGHQAGPDRRLLDRRLQLAGLRERRRRGAGRVKNITQGCVGRADQYGGQMSRGRPRHEITLPAASYTGTRAQ